MACFSPSADLVERFRRDFEMLAADAQGGLAVAVSGGPDSMALLLLAQAAYPGRIQAVTVDHGLRPEGAEEAALVGRHCAAINIPHATLTISVVADGSGIQASARKARYEVLGRWLASAGLVSLLTAHHADDQAETLIMRLLRGSGVAGLAGIRARIPFPAGGEGAFILRPLLGWRRQTLAAIIADSGFETVQDPSNADEAFDRARIRRQLSETTWIDPVLLARSASALADAEEALEARAQELAAERIDRKNGNVSLQPEGVPAELLRRLTLRCLRLVAPAAAPRGDQLTLLVDQLRRGEMVTLAGVKCSGGARFLFAPAPPRRS